MHRKLAFLIFVLSVPGSINNLIATEPTGKILEAKGQLLIRKAFENQWQPVESGQYLAENDALQATPKSSATIEVGSDRHFQLPQNTIIEGKELKSYSNTELVLILTSMEILNLPPQKRQLRPPAGAFVIHGEKIEDGKQSGDYPAQKYVELELNGMQALIAQEFWAGVLLKGIKLRKYQELVNLEEVDFQILRAYSKLNLTRRLRQAQEQFIRDYPDSDFIERVNELN